MKDKILMQHLLKGGYICSRPGRDKRFTYALYSGNMSIIAAVTTKQYKRFSELFKTNRSKTTLNLLQVRRQHGNSFAKQLYKQSKSIKNETKLFQ